MCKPLRLQLVEVPLEGLWIGSNIGDKYEQMEILSSIVGHRAERADGRVILPVHPLQAKLLAEDDRVKRLLEAEIIKMVGESGRYSIYGKK